jgi:Family of unknown function (DUF6510)
MMENRLDGNAAAGMLQEVFPFDMTLAQVTCAGCNATTMLGALMLYPPGMGMILRCPYCESALLRMVHARGSYWLDMRGTRVLRIGERE